MSSSQPLTYLDLAEGIIVSLGTIYGNLFTSQWPDSKARERTVRVWASAIEEANLTPDSIKSGLRTCKVECLKPPSPAEFLKLCGWNAKNTVTPESHRLMAKENRPFRDKLRTGEQLESGKKALSDILRLIGRRGDDES